VVIEQYRSEADFAAHMQKPYLKDLLAKAPALVAAPPEIKTYKPVK
jgi:quinol monooxygenase YgiN